ncbi:MAG TPA: ferritin-like domain-containing protein, partial [Polyangiaceae bacterium]
MRLSSTLLQIALLASLSGACSSSHNPDSCPNPPDTIASATPAQACAIMQSSGDHGPGTPCDALCSAVLPLENGTYHYCSVPADYMSSYAGASVDAGSSSSACPSWSATVDITCNLGCVGGRGTAGVAMLDHDPGGDPGDILVERAYLEAVSVHAFARMESELAAHGAPAALLRGARRARRDEVRHTAMVSRLARRHGGAPRTPHAPAPTSVRPLLAIALENAVEGCVRETYGAVVNLVEARASSDPAVRRAMKSIAEDECRHAELAWEVAA